MFEENDYERPIIVGHLYCSKLSEQLQGILNTRILHVTESADLPIGTNIGAVGYDKLFYTKNVTSDIQEQLDDIRNSSLTKNNLVNINKQITTLTNRVANETTLGNVKSGNGFIVASDGKVSFRPTQTSGSISYLDQFSVNFCRGNRFECLPQDCLTTVLQQWDNETETWVNSEDEYSVTTDIFNTSNQSGITIGINNSDISKYKVILDIDLTKCNPTIYSTINKFYFWVSTQGGTLKCKIYGSSAVRPELHELTDLYNLSGWSGSNIIPVSITVNSSANANNHTSSQYNKLQLVFESTMSTDKRFPVVMKVAAYGVDAWSYNNNMSNIDHMYTWDNDCNVTFPKKVKAQTPTTSDDDNTVVTIGMLKNLGLI